MIRSLVTLGAVALLQLPAQAQTAWQCPDAEMARQAFLSGEMADWPNYSEADGARVQRQYPETAFIGAQAKYIEWNGRTGAICQYYSHIGLVATMLALDLTKHPAAPACEAGCEDEPYWRSEYRESSADLDEPGKEFMDVCMERREGLAFPSTGCGFLVPSE